MQQTIQPRTTILSFKKQYPIRDLLNNLRTMLFIKKYVREKGKKIYILKVGIKFKLT